jgi:hypothetical protein
MIGSALGFSVNELGSFVALLGVVGRGGGLDGLGPLEVGDQSVSRSAGLGW